MPETPQRIWLPAILGVIVLASTIGYQVLHGSEAIAQTVTGCLLACACFGVAIYRRSLRG